MTIAVIFVLVGFLSIAALIFLAKDRGAQPGSLAELRERISSLDIQAFRNLIDPNEDEYLRSHLCGHEFRVVQRERRRAAIEYVLLASRNAAILHRLGDSARLSSDPSVVAAGQRLVSSAIQFRIFAFQVLANFYIALLVPHSIRSSRITEDYEQMNSLVVLLCCLQQQGRRPYLGKVAQLS